MNNIEKKKMNSNAVFPIILAVCFVLFPSAHADPSVAITMEKTTYSYCEKLFYTIEVSEVTGELAIIHIRDETGKGSSAIPIEITNLQNPIPALFPFEKDRFPLGKYFIDVEYAGAKDTAEFDLVDSDNICISGIVKQFLIEWYHGKIPDGYLIDAFQKHVDAKLIFIPFEINDENIKEITIPVWVKSLGYWWIQEIISDEDFIHAINYLINKNIIS